MKIDRKNVVSVFDNYVKDYDITDEKIRLKVEHTYKVSENCERIAIALGLSADDTEIAWLIGMLHDVGRFEQVRQYGTFYDSESVNHAEFGADILFKEGRIRDYVSDESADELIETAIRLHNLYELPADLDERTLLFSQIIRDADKIDILRVHVESPMDKVYDMTMEELMMSEVSDGVMESYKREETILRSLETTPADVWVSHLALVFGLVYPCSVRIANEQGFVEKMLDFKTNNPKTQKQFEEIRKCTYAFVERMLG